MKDQEIMQLTLGSSYQITSLGSKEEPIVSKGKFLGFAVVGAAEAVCLKLDKSYKKLAGKTRMIPSHMILALDVITEAKARL